MSLRSTPAEPGHVYLVGAGPGRADLLTVRALRLLETASHVLPDGLVAAEVLAMVPAATQIISVAKRSGTTGTSQAGINEQMIELARAGGSVVRLKSGDPLVFGRAGEEIAALRAAAIPFEVVPGITAAFAAAARLQQPLTDRASSSRLILATAHHARNRPELDPDPQPLWEGPLPADATLVVYMPGPADALAERLLSAGIAGETPVTAMSRIAQPDERTCHTRLDALAATDCGPAPVLLLLGNTMRRT